MLSDRAVALKVLYPRAEMLRQLLRRSSEQGAKALLADLEQAMAGVRGQEAAEQRRDSMLGLHLTPRASVARPVSLSGDLRLVLGYDSHTFGLEADVARAAADAGIDVELDCDLTTFYAALRSEADARRLVTLLKTLMPSPQPPDNVTT
jgi:hypothetical protein